MRVVTLGSGTRWTVQAVLSPNDECQLLDMVMQLGELGARVLADLQHHVPDTPNDHWARTEFSRLLEDGIYEFRWPTRKGGTPRVLWFYQPGRVIVCSCGEAKKGKLSEGLLEQAHNAKKAYELAVAKGALVVLPFEAI